MVSFQFQLRTCDLTGETLQPKMVKRSSLKSDGLEIKTQPHTGRFCTLGQLAEPLRLTVVNYEVIIPIPVRWLRGLGDCLNCTHVLPGAQYSICLLLHILSVLGKKFKSVCAPQPNANRSEDPGINHWRLSSHGSYSLKYQGTGFRPWGLKLFWKTLKKWEMLRFASTRQLMSARPFGSLDERFL